MTLMPLPRSTFLIVLNLASALIVGAIGFGVGFAQGQLAQTVVLFTVITVAALFWFANYVAVAFESRRATDADGGETDAVMGPVGARSVWAANRVLIVAMALLLLAYLIITATVPPFRILSNLIAFLVLEAILVFAFKVSSVFVHGRSAFIGLIVLIALVVISAFTIEGFLSATNIKAVLLFASFLGIACVGQTLVALMGGLDLSIPFVIGSANIGLLYLVGLGVPPWFAFALVIIIGGLIGFLNGVMSYKLQGQALIMTLGTGFAVAGLVQIITSIGSQFSGNVFGISDVLTLCDPPRAVLRVHAPVVLWPSTAGIGVPDFRDTAAEFPRAQQSPCWCFESLGAARRPSTHPKFRLAACALCGRIERVPPPRASPFHAQPPPALSDPRYWGAAAEHCLQYSARLESFPRSTDLVRW